MAGVGAPIILSAGLNRVLALFEFLARVLIYVLPAWLLIFYVDYPGFDFQQYDSYVKKAISFAQYSEPFSASLLWIAGVIGNTRVFYYLVFSSVVTIIVTAFYTLCQKELLTKFFILFYLLPFNFIFLLDVPRYSLLAVSLLAFVMALTIHRYKHAVVYLIVGALSHKVWFIGILFLAIHIVYKKFRLLVCVAPLFLFSVSVIFLFGIREWLLELLGLSIYLDNYVLTGRVRVVGYGVLVISILLYVLRARRIEINEIFFHVVCLYSFLIPWYFVYPLSVRLLLTGFLLISLLTVLVLPRRKFYLLVAGLLPLQFYVLLNKDFYFTGF